MTNIRVKTWKEFKEIAHDTNPACVVYVIAQSVPAANHTGLKLLMPFQGGQYIFTDTAKGTTMRRTKIPIHTNSRGHLFLTDEDVIRFLKSELKVPNLKVFSYWTA